MQDTIISHPGVQHVYHFVNALDKSGRLKTFYTSFYNKNPKVFSFEIFKRRYIKDFNSEKIINIPYYEIIERFFGSSEKLVYWRDRMFDKHVSFKIKNENVVGYLNASYYTFRKTKGIKILDAAIAHYKDAENILNEEKKLFPEWADSITYSVFPKSYKERVDKELKIADKIIVASDFSKESYIKNG
ncbi:hypothetical protein KY334_04645, partial [Candidatus Woesearchaeota archaeon]|nr:hypothetical protein [Candidatus Woesearchaeota archaeon]